MKEPEKPYPPEQWEFQQEFEEKVLHQVTYIYPNVTQDVEESLLEEVDTESEEELNKARKALNIKEWWYDEDISLSQLMAKIPKGADLKNIFIRTHRDRHVQYIQSKLIQKIPTDKAELKAEYDRQYAKYLKKKEKYDEAMAAYKEFKRQKEISSCKERLKELNADGQTK